MKKIIKGKRVILRPLCDNDASFFAHWYNHPEVMFQCGFHEPTTLKIELDNIQKPETSERDWYAVTTNDGKLIGETGLLRLWAHWFTTDLSIIIPDPEDQRQGFGSEAVQIMLDRAFNYYNLNRVAIGVVALNKKALTFYEKLGFKGEGIQEQGYYHNGSFSDFIMMRILKSEYNQTIMEGSCPHPNKKS